MNSNIKMDETMQTIDIIRERIEDARVHYSAMYLTCFLLSVFYLTNFVLVMLTMAYPVLSIHSFLIFRIILQAIVLFIYLLIYKNEKKFSNKYYLSLLNIWGFISIFVPIVANVSELIGRTFAVESYEIFSASAPGVIIGFSEILLFSIFLIICSYIMNNNWFRVASLVILTVWMIVYTCFFDKGISIPPYLQTQEQMGIGYVTIYKVIITCFGYCMMGCYLRYREGKSKENGYK